MINIILEGLQKLTKPKILNEARARQEYILNIMLITLIILTAFGGLIIISLIFFSNLKDYKNNYLLIIAILGFLFFLISLYLLSRHGHIHLTAYIFIFTLFVAAIYLGCKWGVDLPAEILFYVLAIVTSVILIGTKTAFITTGTISLTIFLIGYLQNLQIINANRSWVSDPWGFFDVIVSSIILFIIALVSWLFNRELEKSLYKIKESEKELKIERDLLATRVEEKAKELRIIQAKEIAQIYHFAEFGKLASGLFHDLANPLTAVMLNINKIKMDNENSPNFNLINSEINQALKASEKMKDLINLVRKQISFKDQQTNFSLNQEIEEAIVILNYKAQKNQIQILFTAEENIIISGDPIKFNQIVTNLLSNAIDSYNNDLKKFKKIIINLNNYKNYIELSVKDNGQGINENIINHIFEPFFTTKPNSEGLGLGLSLIKKIIEESFTGTIKVFSNLDSGATFKVCLPLPSNNAIIKEK